jgi:DNA-binding response OmpR family regulator
VISRASPRLRTVIVDDEPLARRRLRALLTAHPDVEVVAECADGPEAVAAITRERPDLVFLDVQMPEGDGFSVVRAVGVEQMPTVVFVTAYDQYALDAFEVHALDYLLKPFDEDRFVATLERVRLHHARVRAQESNERLMALLERLPGGSGVLTEEAATEAAAQPLARRRFGMVEVDVAARRVWRNGEEVSLRPKELDLLFALLRREGQVATRRELLTEVWGYNQTVVSRTVDTHIGELRRKLERDPSNPVHILTVAKSGYRIES